MRFRYRNWSGKELSRLQFEDLLNLFNNILLTVSGDVNAALNAMQQLNARYGIFHDNIDFDDFLKRLEDEGYIKVERGKFSVTPRGTQKIRKDSLNQIFSSLKTGSFGNHRIASPGKDIERTAETRPYQFGDNLSNLDVTQSINNALSNHGIREITLHENDLVSFETEDSVTCATVLLVDISHSMVLYGEDRITPAKKVALALSELIMTKYPRDRLNVAVFGDNAQEITVGQLPFLTVGPYHTNTKAGLSLARELLRKVKTSNKQVFMITDGKPSCIFRAGKLYKNSWGLDPMIVNQTLNEADACRKEKIVISTFMIAQDPYLQKFVEKLTKVNRGRAYFAAPGDLSEYIFVDFIRNRKRRLH